MGKMNNGLGGAAIAHDDDLANGSEYEAYVSLCGSPHLAEVFAGHPYDSPEWAEELKHMAVCFQTNDDAAGFERLATFEIDRLMEANANNETLISRTAFFLMVSLRFESAGWNDLARFRLMLLDKVARRCLEELGSHRRVSKALGGDITTVLSLLPLQLYFGSTDSYRSCHQRLQTMANWRLPKANKAVIDSALRILPDPSLLEGAEQPSIVWPIKLRGLRSNPLVTHSYFVAASLSVSQPIDRDEAVELTPLGDARLRFDVCRGLAYASVLTQDNPPSRENLEFLAAIIRNLVKESKDCGFHDKWEGLNALCDYYEACWSAFFLDIIPLDVLSPDERKGLVAAHTQMLETCADGKLALADLELIEYTLLRVISLARQRTIFPEGAGAARAGFETALALLHVLNTKTRLSAMLARDEPDDAARRLVAIEDDAVAFEFASWSARELLAHSCLDQHQGGLSPDGIEWQVELMNRNPELLGSYYSELASHKNLRYKVDLLRQGGEGLSRSLGFIDNPADHREILAHIPDGSTLVDLFFIRENPLFFGIDPRSDSNRGNQPRHLLSFAISPVAEPNWLRVSYLGTWDELDRPLSDHISGNGTDEGSRLLRRLTGSMLTLADEDSASTIIFCSDGLFNNVSLSSLPYGKGYVVDRFAVRNISSVEDVSSGQVGMGTRRGLVLSNPLFGSGSEASYRPLKGSIVEGRDAAAFLSEAFGEGNVEHLTRGDASKRNLIGTLGARGGLSVIHLSSHGDLRDGVPCIVLSGANDGKDAFLLPADIPCNSMEGTDLVALALCYGGAMSTTPGDGMSGFVKATLLNGASSAILPVSEVNDEASVVFFKLFYSRYLSNRHLPIEVVARDTILTMRSLDEEESKSVLASRSAHGLRDASPHERGDGDVHPYDRLDCWGPWVCYSNSFRPDPPSVPPRGGANNGRGIRIADDAALTIKGKRLMRQALKALRDGTTDGAAASFRHLDSLERKNQLTARAAGLLASCYLGGYGVEADGDRGAALAEAAANAGDAFAQYLVGRCSYLGLHLERSPKRAAESFICAAQEGDPESALYLSEMYYYGCGVERSCAESSKWAERALGKGGEALGNGLLVDIAKLYLASSRLVLSLGDPDAMARAVEALTELERKRGDVIDLLPEGESCPRSKGGLCLLWKNVGAMVKAYRGQPHELPVCNPACIRGCFRHLETLSPVSLPYYWPNLELNSMLLDYLDSHPEALTQYDRYRYATSAAAASALVLAYHVCNEFPRQGRNGWLRQALRLRAGAFVELESSILCRCFPGFEGYLVATIASIVERVPGFKGELSHAFADWDGDARRYLENHQGLLYLLSRSFEKSVP